MIEVFKALSDENRLRILHLLSHKELCVCELEVLLNLTQSNVSRHLNKLKQAELISLTKSGQWAHYQLNREYFNKNSPLLEYLQKNWLADPLYGNDTNRLNCYSEQHLSCKDIAEDKNHVELVLLGGKL